jgi:hypothetical protein
LKNRSSTVLLRDVHGQPWHSKKRDRIRARLQTPRNGPPERGRAAIYGRVEYLSLDRRLQPAAGPKGLMFVQPGRGSKEPLFHNLVPKNTFVQIFVEERPFMAASHL